MSKQNLPRLLIADDERNISEGLQMLLQEDGYDVDAATDGEEAWEQLSSGEYGLVLADLNMPRLDGLELFARMRDQSIDSEIIIISGQGTVDSAVEAMRHGAYDYLTKPLDLEQFTRVVQAIEEFWVTVVRLPTGKP